jgi:hypothetical protein
MNVFDFEFRGSLLTADRQYTPTFKAPANVNRSDYILSGNAEPYDLSLESNLTLSFCFDSQFLNYSNVTVNVVGVSPSATTAAEIVTALNSSNAFSSFFVAQTFTTNMYNVTGKKILIKSVKPKSNFKAYVVNSSAEGVIGFNKNAPIAELPSYFKRYSIANRFNYPDLVERLLLLDTSNSIEADYIDAAGFDSTSPKADWQLLKGCNDQYMFTKKVYTSGLISAEIKYPAGASEGDAAFKTTYQYTGSSLIGICEIPHIIASGDLITPP